MSAVTEGRERLRVAVQKKGRLADAAREMLAGCGLTWRESRDRLFCYGEGLPVDLLLVRDDDIPGLIADGVCDLGVVGLNVLEEFTQARMQGGLDAAVRAWRPLGFGACRLDIAVPETSEWAGPQQLAGLCIATSYPALLGRWLDEQGVQAEVVTMSGSVEIAPRLGQADVVCDLVSSGATLAANQLRPVATVLSSEAVLAGPQTPLPGPLGELADLLLRRLDDAARVQAARLLLLKVAPEALEEVRALLPAGSDATVLALAGGATELAVQVLCPGEVGWQTLETLRRAGARSLVVVPVEGMLL